MISDRWQRIEELFHATLQVAELDRARYLTDECAGDERLREEVASLLIASEKEPSFIEVPALSLGIKVLSQAGTEPLIGKSVGHYKIIQLLGSGGMGEVFLAEDQRLERQVALKFLSRVLVDDEWARNQLMAEARAIAKLENPNICQVYGIEEISDYKFIVMQYIEGETLDSLLRRGAVDLNETIKFALQIISALAAAHSHGIIHRDVKPQNIIVMPTGRIKVLDFGLAKLTQPDHAVIKQDGSNLASQVGFVVGTVAYMSPEQTNGEALDNRSDIFSFGIVFYEMLAGINPFLREQKEDTLIAIRTVEPPPLPVEVPPEARNISARCLQKDRLHRYKTTPELLAELQSFHEQWSRKVFWSYANLKKYALAAAVLLLVISAAGSFAYYEATKTYTLAILPFANNSSDPTKDYLSVGLTRNLFDKFSYLPRLKAKLPNNAPARDNSEVLEAGRRLNVEAVLNGEILRQGDSFFLRLQLLTTADGKVRWGETFNIDAANLFTLQDQIVERVTSNMGLWLSGREQELLAKRQTDNEEALRSYMKGRRLWQLKRDEKNVAAAIDHLEEAVELDPAFALAYSGLADCYVIKANNLYGAMDTKDAMEKARSNAQLALDIDPSLPEAHTSMGVVRLKYDWDWPAAEKELRLAIDLNPDYAQAHYWYSNLLAVVGRHDESVKESELARNLDPYSPLAKMNHGRALYYAGRFPEAEAELRNLLEEIPDYPQASHVLAYVLLKTGKQDEAISILQRLHASNPKHAAAALGYSYGRAGRRDEALRMLDELNQLSRYPYEKALVHLGLGNLNEAFNLLEESFQDRYPNLIYIRTEPIFDGLRADPRYAVLAQRIGLNF
jgi:serine/threonine protein kinase/Tfp pilus assembly protein PilF